MHDAIIVQHLSKQFLRYHADRPMTFHEALSRGLRRLLPIEQFWALRDVNFHVARGRMLGIIGPNGAGKSLLLRLIGGVGRPDEGSIDVNGRIGALLDLGAGFHPDLTGRENVFVNGVIAGLTRQEVAQRFESIVAFAELEEFIDSPLRTYSSGMQMRLAFAVAVHIEPDVVLIDEVLAVGDLSFQQKCLEKIAQFKENGCTIVLVAHDMTLIRELCDDVLWLRKGKVVAHGIAEVVAGQYETQMMAETRRRTPRRGSTVRTNTATELVVNENRFGSLELEITETRLIDASGHPATEFTSGDTLRVEIDYRAANPIPSPIFGVTITREDGVICYDTSTSVAGINLPTVQGMNTVALQFERLDLNGGRYYVDVGAYERNWAYAYDYHWHVYSLNVRQEDGEKGILRPPHYWDVAGILTRNVSPLMLIAAKLIFFHRGHG